MHDGASRLHPTEDVGVGHTRNSMSHTRRGTLLQGSGAKMSRIATFAFRRQVDRAQVSPTQPSPLCPLRAKQIGRARRPFREGLTGAYCTPNAVRPTTSGRWS